MVQIRKSLILDEKWKNLFSLLNVSKHENGYYHVLLPHGKKEKIHRVITGALPGQIVDHINGMFWDNRECNLRICNHSQNLQNRKKIKKECTSTYKGVWVCKKSGKYSAGITCNYISYKLGYYESEIEAAYAYNVACKVLHKEFAILNDLAFSDKMIDEKVMKKLLQPKKEKTSIFRGVSKHRSGKWYACISHNGQPTKRIGLFVDEIDAAKAYNKAALELHGEFAKLNIIED